MHEFIFQNIFSFLKKLNLSLKNCVKNFKPKYFFFQISVFESAVLEHIFWQIFFDAILLTQEKKWNHKNLVFILFPFIHSFYHFSIFDYFWSDIKISALISFFFFFFQILRTTKMAIKMIKLFQIFLSDTLFLTTKTHFLKAFWAKLSKIKFYLRKSIDFIVTL